MPEQSNASNTSGNENISIQGLSNSPITINASKTDNNATFFPRELTLSIPKVKPADIIGREQDLEELHELLFSEKEVVVVNGLGGIGKTTLAQVYVGKYYDDYEHIAWISQTSESIITDLLNTEGLLKCLGVEATNPDPQQLFEEVVLKLRGIEEKPNLLVIDNAEGSLYQHRHVLPAQPKWHLLITSREAIEGFHLKQLGFLNEEQAMELFQKHYTIKKLKEEEIKELVRTVEYHTLTIEVLAKTAKVQRYEATQLKAAIEQDIRANVTVERRGEKVERIGSYLSTVFSLSKLSEQELWLMKQFVCLPSEFHSYEVLRELIITEESPYQESFSETLSVLTQKGWLLYNQEVDSYKMHRIIAEVVKKQHNISLEEVIGLIGAVTDKLMVDQSTDNPVEKFIWVPFGKALLDCFGENTSREIALLQNNLGLVLQEQGQYQQAKELLQKAVASDEKNFGAEHPSTAISYSNLAMVLQSLGEYEQAKELMQKAVASDEKNFGAEHPSTAISYSNLAMVLQDLGEYEQAKELLQKAVASDEKNFGTEHPSTARSYSNLATVLQDLGEYEQAKELLQKAVASDEKNFGTEHPSTANRYSNLALVLRNLGESQQAKELLQKAVASNEKNFGAEHPYTAIRYSNLALVLKDLGEYEEAKELLQKAVASAEKNFGVEHPSTATSYSNLALVLRNLGEYQQAKELLQKAVASDEKNFGVEHPSTATSYSNLATVLQDLGEYQQALELSGKALAIFESALPEGHPYINTATDNYQSIKRELE